MASSLGAGKMVTDGLVLCLDAANVKSYPGSGTTWTDLSPTAASASLINGPSFLSTSNGSIWFDSTNDYVPTNLFGTYQNITLGAWVFPAKNITSTVNIPNGYDSYIINKNYFFATSTNSWPVSFAVNQSGTGSYIQITKGTSFQISTSGAIASGSILAGKWSYITGTYDKSSLKMYVNGVLTQTVAYSDNINYTGSLDVPWTVARSAGQYGGGVGTSFATGSIAIAQIYNRALSAAEILQNYEATRERFGV